MNSVLEEDEIEEVNSPYLNDDDIKRLCMRHTWTIREGACICLNLNPAMEHSIKEVNFINDSKAGWAIETPETIVFINADGKPYHPQTTEEDKRLV